MDNSVEEIAANNIAIFTHSQKGKRLLTVNGFVYQLNKSRNKLYWLCERRRDIRCSACVITDASGIILKGATSVHVHTASGGRVEALNIRHDLLGDSIRRPEAAPSSLLNEHVTPATVLNLPSEVALKQAINRKRRAIRPKDPETAANLEICGTWTETLDGANWYIGETGVGGDCCYIFSTEDNLRKLNVSKY